MPQASRPDHRIGETEMSAVLSLAEECVATFAVDLTGLNVVAPAVTGYEAATATLALLAGARGVTAIALPSTRFHSAEEAADTTLRLAGLAGLESRIAVQERIDHNTCATANVLVASGPVRPITRSLAERLPSHAVIVTAGEAWKILPGEIDTTACREYGIPVVGVNESDLDVGGLEYQPALCLRMLHAAGVAPDGAMLALICDNPLGPVLQRGLRAAGAQAVLFASAHTLAQGEWAAVVLAQRPAGQPRLGIRELGFIAKAAPGAVIVQYWGDIDRTAARYFGLAVWPARTPGKGQTGLALETLGPEPTVRLAAGALKVAQLVLAGVPASPGGLMQMPEDPG